MSTMTAEDILFFIFAATAAISALLVIFMANPVYSALFLALTMSVLGALFFMLQGYFVSVAQITVYAGAVMVLFVMVLMLFDLRREHEDVFRLSPINMAKIAASVLLCAFLVVTAKVAIGAAADNPSMQVAPGVTQNDLAKGDQGLPPAKTTTAGEKEAGVQPGPEDHALNAASAQGVANAADGTTSAGAQAGAASAQGAANAANDAASAQAQAGTVTGAATTNPDEDLTNAEAKKLVEQAPQKDESAASVQAPPEFGSTVSLSERLFSKYVFAFEAVSLLLLVAIVGAVALARSKGGTHHAA